MFEDWGDHRSLLQEELQQQYQEASGLGLDQSLMQGSMAHHRDLLNFTFIPR